MAEDTGPTLPYTRATTTEGERCVTVIDEAFEWKPSVVSKRNYTETGFGGPMAPDHEQRAALAALVDTVHRWRHREPTRGDRVMVFRGLALAAVALAESLDYLPVESAKDLFETVLASTEISAALQCLAENHADISEASPELFQKPDPEYRFPGSVNIPDEVAKRRRIASPAEAAEYTADVVAVFRKESKMISLANSASTASLSAVDGFLPPCTPWGSDLNKTALYRWYDADDVLLYVGITDDLATRQSSHVKRSSWAQFAARSTVEWTPNRGKALIAERSAIRAERPLFNHVHNDDKARHRLVEYLVQHGRTDLLTPAVSRG